MNQFTRHKKIFVLLLMFIAVRSQAQQEFTFNTSAANITSAQALIDLPGLSGNANAIIIATPLGNTKTMNPHPTGAWYYSNKWYIFNTDFAPMLPGLSYKVQYFLSPGANEFMHLVTQGNLGAEGSYIDNPALNNKPNAQFSIFQNHEPTVRSGSWHNPNEAKTGYSAITGKWYITNINAQPLSQGCAYNIVVSNGGTISHIPPGGVGTIDGTTNCNCPASLPPSGIAGGDLSGNFPNPIVSKLSGRSVAATVPNMGQVLKWNGSEWAPANESGGNIGTSYTGGLGIDITGGEINALAGTAIWNASKILGRDVVTTPPELGQVLKWGGGAWVPSEDNTGSGTSGTYTAGTGIRFTGNEISSTHSDPIWNANRLMGRNIVATNPIIGQVLKWNGSSWYPANDSIGNTTATVPNPLYNNTNILEGWSTLTLTPGSPGIEVPLPGLSYIYHFTTPVKALISFNVPSNTILCLGCGITGIFLFLKVNGVLARRYYWEVANNSSFLLSGSALLTLPQGEQKIELIASAFGPTVNLGYSFTRSTLITQIIPQ